METDSQIKIEVLKSTLNKKTKRELIGLCRKHKIKRYSGKNKSQLVDWMSQHPCGIFDNFIKIKANPPDTREPAHSTPTDESALKLYLDDALQVTWKDKYINHIYGLASVIGVILAIYPYVKPPSPSAESKRDIQEEVEPQSTPFAVEGDDDVFQRKEGSYCILILPFAPLQNCTVQDTEIEQTLKKRLLEKSKNENLSLEVKFNKGAKCPRDYDEGREFGKQFNADLVIWGDFYEQCSSEHEACLRYALVNNPWAGIEETGKTEVEKFRLSEIFKGRLQEDIDFIILWSLGMREYDRKNYDKALAYFKSCSTGSTDPYILSHCYAFVRDWKKAIEYFLKIILQLEHATVESTSYQVFGSEGEIFGMEREKLFIREISHEISLNLNKIGYCYLELEKWGQAIEYFHRVRANPEADQQSIPEFSEIKRDSITTRIIFPELAAAFTGRGNSYFLANEYNKAITDYDQAIKFHPLWAAGLFMRGVTYERLNMYDEAIGDYSWVIALNDVGRERHFYNSRKTHPPFTKDFMGINYEYSQSHKLDIHYLARAYYYRGNLHRIAKRYDLAISDYEHAIRLNLRYVDDSSNNLQLEKNEVWIECARQAIDDLFEL